MKCRLTTLTTGLILIVTGWCYQVRTSAEGLVRNALIVALCCQMDDCPHPVRFGYFSSLPAHVMSRALLRKELLMILGNTLSNYLHFLLAFAMSIGLALLFKYVVIDKIKYFASKTKNKLDDVIISFISSISLLFYFLLSLYIAIQFVLNAFVRSIIDAVFITVSLHQVIFAIRIFIEYFLDKRATEENGASIAHVKDILQLIMRVVFWAIGILFILSNLGINVTSLVAGWHWRYCHSARSPKYSGRFVQLFCDSVLINLLSKGVLSLLAIRWE